MAKKSSRSAVIILFILSLREFQAANQNQEKQQKNHPFPIQFQEQFRNQSHNETGKNNKKAEIGQFFQG